MKWQECSDFPHSYWCWSYVNDKVRKEAEIVCESYLKRIAMTIFEIHNFTELNPNDKYMLLTVQPATTTLSDIG